MADNDREENYTEWFRELNAVWLYAFPSFWFVLLFVFYRRRHFFPISKRLPYSALAGGFALVATEMINTTQALWPRSYVCMDWALSTQITGNAVIAIFFGRCWALYFRSHLHHEQMLMANARRTSAQNQNQNQNQTGSAPTDSRPRSRPKPLPAAAASPNANSNPTHAARRVHAPAPAMGWFVQRKYLGDSRAQFLSVIIVYLVLCLSLVSFATNRDLRDRGITYASYRCSATPSILYSLALSCIFSGFFAIKLRKVVDSFFFLFELKLTLAIWVIHLVAYGLGLKSSDSSIRLLIWHCDVAIALAINVALPIYQTYAFAATAVSTHAKYDRLTLAASVSGG